MDKVAAMPRIQTRPKTDQEVVLPSERTHLDFKWDLSHNQMQEIQVADIWIVLMDSKTLVLHRAGSENLLLVCGYGGFIAGVLVSVLHSNTVVWLLNSE